jgi:lysozyme family protein
MNLQKALQILTSPEIEGDYSDHPNDPGGKTRFGITEAVARANGYTGDMRDLPHSLALRIAEKDYWAPLRCDEMPPNLRYPLFDAGYHSGNRAAVRWLQTALGVTADGVLGPRTMAVASQNGDLYTRNKMVAARLRAMRGMSGWPTFSRGWAARIAYILSMPLE